MTLIELHTACIKLCRDADKSTRPSDLADAIAAIQLPEQEPVAELEKQVVELKTRLNKNVSLLVNETLQSENEILLKQVEIFKSALEKLSCLGNGDKRGNSKGNLIAIEALERAKC